MARIINEKRNINDNVFEYEKRLQSPYNKYIDKSATYVTYYHIDNDNTTVNDGWRDTEELLGENSSLRFTKIDSLPIYGISQVVINIEDNDQGLDGSYEGEAIFLPHTIKPYENDFFVIEHLNRHNPYVFRITAIEFDNIHPDNFYKATFVLEGTDISYIEKLESQITNKYICIDENIGTEQKCIIESSRYQRIKEVEKVYDNLASTYLSIFYNERYNILLGEKMCGKKVYDPFLIEFVNKWGLFNHKDTLTTYIFGQEVTDNRFMLKYEKSLWRFIERRELSIMTNFYYVEYPGIDIPYSTFALWHDKNIWVTDISLDMNSFGLSHPIFSNEFIENVKTQDEKAPSDYAAIIKSFVRKDKMDIYSIPLNLYESLLSLNANMEFFFFVPVILYIIKKIIDEELKTVIYDNSIKI